MAIFNEILVGRYNRFFQKFFGMKGGPPAPQLAGEISPSFPLMSGVENYYLEGWSRYATGLITAATVAQINGVRFRNPKASNVIAVLEKLLLNSNTAQRLFIQTDTTDVNLPGGLGGTAVCLDPRVSPPTVSSILQLSTATNSPATTNNWMQPTVLAGTDYDVINYEGAQLFILPGQAITVLTQAANTTLIVSALWRERLMEEGERT